MESHLLDNTASAQPLHLRTTAVQTAKAKTALITTDEPVSKTKNKRYQLVSSCTAICTNTIQVALRKNVVEMFATALSKLMRFHFFEHTVTYRSRSCSGMRCQKDVMGKSSCVFGRESFGTARLSRRRSLCTSSEEIDQPVNSRAAVAPARRIYN